MKEKELWDYFWERKISHARPLDRDFVWVTKESFEPVEMHFVKEFNILQRGGSYRSRGYISHIHVLEQGDYIFVHRDTGNVAKFLPLGIIHLFADVVPYYIFARVKKVPMNSIFTRPE